MELGGGQQVLPFRTIDRFINDVLSGAPSTAAAGPAGGAKGKKRSKGGGGDADYEEEEEEEGHGEDRAAARGGWRMSTEAKKLVAACATEFAMVRRDSIRSAGARWRRWRAATTLTRARPPAARR